MMFGLFKRRDKEDDGSDTTEDFVYDQALIVRIPQAREMGDEDMLQKILSFEEDIEKKLPPQSGIDGHELGDNEANIYIYGPDADLIHGSVEDILARYFAGCGAEVTLQYGSPDDDNTVDRKIAL